MAGATATAERMAAQPRGLELRRLLSDPLGRLGLILVVIVVVGAVGADQIATHDPFKMAIRERLQAPSLAHFLGTDNLGRDTFSRVLYGGRLPPWGSFIAGAPSPAFGPVLGLLPGCAPPRRLHLPLRVFG